jgi:hypothetical protein
MFAALPRSHFLGSEATISMPNVSDDRLSEGYRKISRRAFRGANQPFGEHFGDLGNLDATMGVLNVHVRSRRRGTSIDQPASCCGLALAGIEAGG